MLDYVALAQSRLTSFFDKSLIKGLTGAMIAPLALAEEVAVSLRDNRWIATAVGKQLDGCGHIVGESRQGRSDDDYREAIIFRVFINTSKATPEDLIYALRFITKPDDLQYIEQYPATAMLFTDGALVNRAIEAPPLLDLGIGKSLKPFMQDLAPAGISDLSIMVSYSRRSPFRFGKELNSSDFFVNADTDNMDVNGADLQVISQSTSSKVSRLGGIAAADFFVGDFYLDVGLDSFAVNSPETDKILTGGSNLVGVYQ